MLQQIAILQAAFYQHKQPKYKPTDPNPLRKMLLPMPMAMIWHILPSRKSLFSSDGRTWLMANESSNRGFVCGPH